jgi:hypothetical protein
MEERTMERIDFIIQFTDDLNYLGIHADNYCKTSQYFAKNFNTLQEAKSFKAEAINKNIFHNNGKLKIHKRILIIKDCE